MSESAFQGVRIAAVAAAVPEQLRNLDDDAVLFGRDEVEKVAASTGVRQRHYSKNLCTSDLCEAAAKRLFQENSALKEEVDTLIFISQTSDYPLPATSCILQERLGLPKSCASFDVNLGCSGYVYGLWLASSLIASGAARKVLLLVGDTSYRLCSPQDRSVALLFGDAGTATVLEKSSQVTSSHFVLGTDGSGAHHLKVAAGGSRLPMADECRQRTEHEGGNWRSEADLYMNGAEVFAFTLRTVPALMKTLFALSGKTPEDVDAYVFHQANKFMLEHLSKRMKLPADKVVLAMQDYGNTSSASIPLAMVTHLRERLRNETLDLALAGFGVGLSWAGAILPCGPMIIPDLVTVPSDQLK